MSNPGHPWSSDRELDPTHVAELAAAIGPELEGSSAVFLGEGWDSVVYLVDGSWCFKFPKRAEVVPRLEQEAATLPILRDFLDVPIPHLVIFEESREPYPFARYPIVEGVPLDTISFPDEARPRLARELASVLDGFFDATARVEDLVTEEELDYGELRGEALEGLSALRDSPEVSEEQVEQLRAFLASVPEPSPLTRSPGYIHNDLFGDHILVDPSNFRFVGLIDFADQAVGDPVLDLVGIGAALGPRFAVDVAERVKEWAFDSADLDRLHYLLGVMPIRWAANAAGRGEKLAVRRHLEIVMNVI